MQGKCLPILILGRQGTSDDAQRLVLVLHAGVTPGGAQGTIWDAEMEPGLATCMTSVLPAVLFL